MLKFLIMELHGKMSFVIELETLLNKCTVFYGPRKNNHTSKLVLKVNKQFKRVSYKDNQGL